MRLTIAVAMAVVFVVFGIGSLIYWFSTSIMVEREVTGWYSQAIASADAKQLYEFTQKTLSGLRKLGLTEGYHAVLYRTPDNDQAIEYQIIEACAARALEIQKYPIGSMDYAKSLDDVRQQLRAVNISPTYGYLVANSLGGLIFWLWGWLPYLIIMVILFALQDT